MPEGGSAGFELEPFPFELLLKVLTFVGRVRFLLFEFDPELLLFKFGCNTVGATCTVLKLIFELGLLLMPEFVARLLLPDLLEPWNDPFVMHWASNAALALPPFELPPLAGRLGGQT